MVYTWDKAQAFAKTETHDQYSNSSATGGVAMRAGMRSPSTSRPVAAQRHQEVRSRPLGALQHDGGFLAAAMNLATKNPKKLAELQKSLSNTEAKAHHVYPLDDRAGARFDPSKLPLAGAHAILCVLPRRHAHPERSAPYTIGPQLHHHGRTRQHQGRCNGVVVAMGGVAVAGRSTSRTASWTTCSTTSASPCTRLPRRKPLPKGKVKRSWTSWPTPADLQGSEYHALV